LSNAVEPQCGTNLTLGASGDTIIIPSGATISNQGTAAGFGPTGAVSWNTTKITADPNPAVTGVGYFADTTSAAFTITLPSSPSAGAVVGIADYANTFATNNLTVDRNGSNIGGIANNAILSTDGVSITLVYVDATQGWIITDSGSRADVPVPEFVAATGGTVTCCGDFKIHTFTGPGTFTVTSVGNPLGSTAVDYLVVAGAGGGGGTSGGGGGAGGYRTTFPSPGCNAGSFPISVQGYPITVGAGGAGGTGSGVDGNPSVFSTITSTGGGKGGGYRGDPGFSGGSGSGAGGSDGQPGAGSGTAGTGNTPPVAPPQGNPGGNSANPGASGGGGGAGAPGVVGTPGNNTAGGAGGAGSPNSISGSAVTYAGGGGGTGSGATLSPANPNGTGGAGGTGGGGTGSNPGNTNNAQSGTTNTGGGGGGGGYGSPGPFSGGCRRIGNSSNKVQISIKYDKYN
jgi:hypothetical protein